MDVLQFQRVESLFGQACALGVEAQEAFVVQACHDDTAVRDKVLGMLRTEREARIALTRVAAAGASSDPRPESAIPARFGRYTIVRLIGCGGMGEVYLANQDKPKRSVALKAIRPELNTSSSLRRFEWETEVLGRLTHPCIAQVYDAGVDDVGCGPQPYFVMEYVPGSSLGVYAREQRLSTADKLALFAKICDAVHYAHQKGVIHRDLKPGNILVDPSGQPKILDFGIAIATDIDARMTTIRTDVGQLVGTLAYMSPEQLGADPRDIDLRSDVYSLGVCLYELLVDRLPHDVRGKLIHEAARTVIEDEPTSLRGLAPRLGGDIETIVGKALEKDRDRRYPSALEMGNDLRRCLRNEPVSARPPSTFYQLRKFARRNRAVVLSTAVAAMLLLLATITSTWWALTASQARQAESRQRRLADASTQQAKDNERKAQRLVYSMTISAALASENSDRVEARHQLDLAPVELRGWEWDYLSNRVGQPAIVVEPPATAAWTRDGTPVAAVSRDATVRLFDIKTGRTLAAFTLQGASSQVYLSPNASLIFASTGNDQGAAYEAATGKRRYTVAGFANDAFPWFIEEVSQFTMVRTGQRLVEFRDLETGQVRSTFKLPEGLFGVGPGHGIGTANLYLWESHATVDLISGELVQEWQDTDSAVNLAFSDDRSLSAEWVNRPVTMPLVVKSTVGGAILQPWRPHTGGVVTAVFSPSKRFLMTNGVDDQLRIWDLADGRQLANAAVGTCRRMDFSPDESYALAQGDAGVFLLNWRQSPSPRVLDEHQRYVYQVCFSPDGTLLASAGWDQAVHMHDTASGRLIHELPITSHHIGALSFTDDGTYLIALAYAEQWVVENLVVWNAITGEPVSDVNQQKIAHIDHGGAPRSREGSASSPDTSGEQGVAALWWRTARGGSKATRFDGGEHMATSHDRTMLAHAQYKGDLLILDRETLRPRARLAGHDGPVRAVAFSHDDTLLATGGDDRTVRVWDVATGRLLATMTGHSQKVFTVAFSPDGSRIVSGGNDAVIRIWDAEAFEQRVALPGHESYIHSLAFSPDGRILASGSGDGTVRVWDAGPRSQSHRE